MKTKSNLTNTTINNTKITHTVLHLIPTTVSLNKALKLSMLCIFSVVALVSFFV